MDQSEFDANTCNQRQARDNTCERGTIGFSFASHWFRNWNQFRSVVKQNQSKYEIRKYFRHSIENRSMAVN